MNRKNISSKSRTDLRRLAKMKDEDIDLSDIPEIPLTLRIDTDVLQWFKETGKGYQTRINSLLRTYMEESENAGRRKGA
jgi:uncharacterized protein (DUF4415 family)